MKKTFFILGLSFSTYAYTQIGINTDSPKTLMDVRASNDNGTNSGANVSKDGIALPRVSTLENPGVVGGQLVYLTQNWDKYFRGTHIWDASIPDWVMLENPKGTPVIAWAGKLNQNIIQTYNSDGSAGGINSQTRVGGGMVTDMIDELNMFDNTTGTFSPLESGLYRIEIKYDYSYLDIINNSATTMSEPAANAIAPYMLYGLYNDTDAVWMFRNYEYCLAGRRISYSPTTGGYAGKSNYTIGYINMEAGKKYAFYFVGAITTADWNAGKRVVITAQNSGSTGSSDATYFVIQRVERL